MDTIHTTHNALAMQEAAMAVINHFQQMLSATTAETKVLLAFIIFIITILSISWHLSIYFDEENSLFPREVEDQDVITLPEALFQSAVRMITTAAQVFLFNVPHYFKGDYSLFPCEVDDPPPPPKLEQGIIVPEALVTDLLTNSQTLQDEISAHESMAEYTITFAARKVAEIAKLTREMSELDKIKNVLELSSKATEVKLEDYKAYNNDLLVTNENLEIDKVTLKSAKDSLYRRLTDAKENASDLDKKLEEAEESLMEMEKSRDEFEGDCQKFRALWETAALKARETDQKLKKQNETNALLAEKKKASDRREIEERAAKQKYLAESKSKDKKIGALQDQLKSGSEHLKHMNSQMYMFSNATETYKRQLKDLASPQDIKKILRDCEAKLDSEQKWLVSDLLDKLCDLELQAQKKTDGTGQDMIFNDLRQNVKEPEDDDKALEGKGTRKQRMPGLKPKHNPEQKIFDELSNRLRNDFAQMIKEGKLQDEIQKFEQRAKQMEFCETVFQKYCGQREKREAPQDIQGLLHHQKQLLDDKHEWIIRTLYERFDYELADFARAREDQNEQATFKAELEKLQSENAVLRQEIMSRQMASDTKLPHSPLDSQGASASTSNTEDDSENSTSANFHAEESQKDEHEAHGQDEDAGEISKASQPVLSAVETESSSATDDSTHKSTEFGDKSEQIDGNEGENFTLSTPDAHEQIKTNHDAALSETVSGNGESMPICGTNAINEVNDGNRQACEQNTELAIVLDQTDTPRSVDAETCELAGDNAPSAAEPCSEPAHDQDEVEKRATCCANAEDSDYVGEANGDKKDQDENDNGTGSHTTPDDGDDERDTDSESKKVNENNKMRRIHQSAWAWSTPTMLQDPSSSCWAVGGSAAVQIAKSKKSLAKLPKSDNRTLTTGIWHHRVHLQHLERLGCLKRLVKQLANRKHNLSHEQKPKAFVRLPEMDGRTVPTGIPHHQERFRYLEEQHAKGIKQPYLIPNTPQSMQTAPDMVKGLHYNPTERGERGGSKVQQKKKNAKNKQDKAQDGSAAQHLLSVADSGQSNAPPNAPTAPLAFRTQVSFQAAQHAVPENAPTGPRLERNHASTAPLAPRARAGFMTAQHAAPKNAPTGPRLERNRAYIVSNPSEGFAASNSATLHAAPENAPTGPRQDHAGNASEKTPSLAESKFAPRHGAAYKTHFKNQRKN